MRFRRRISTRRLALQALAIAHDAERVANFAADDAYEALIEAEHARNVAADAAERAETFQWQETPPLAA